MYFKYQNKTNKIKIKLNFINKRKFNNENLFAYPKLVLSKMNFIYIIQISHCDKITKIYTNINDLIHKKINEKLLNHDKL